MWVLIRSADALLMSTHLCFHEEIKKNILSGYPYYLVVCIFMQSDQIIRDFTSVVFTLNTCI